MGAVVPFTTFNGVKYEAVPNADLYQEGKKQAAVDGQGHFKGKISMPKKWLGDLVEKSWVDHGKEYFGSANGSFRGLQLLQRVSQLAIEILQAFGSTMVDFFQNVAGICGLGAAAMGIPRLWDVTPKAYNAITDWFNAKGVPADEASRNRDTIQKIHDVADGAAAWGYAGSLVTGSATTLADGLNLIADVTDLEMAAQDWSLAKAALNQVNKTEPENGSMQQRFMDTMTNAFLRIVKAVSSVASGVLGMMTLVLGGPVIPLIMLIGIKLVSTTSSMGSHFFTKTRDFEMVDFYKNLPTVQVLA